VAVWFHGFKYCDFSVNTTLDGNSFKISTNEAKEIVNKTPEFAEPQPLEPIGEWCFFTVVVC